MELACSSTVTKEKSRICLLRKNLKFIHKSDDSAHDNGDDGGDCVCISGG